MNPETVLLLTHQLLEREAGEIWEVRQARSTTEGKRGRRALSFVVVL